jgi:hypothetical protein
MCPTTGFLIVVPDDVTGSVSPMLPLTLEAGMDILNILDGMCGSHFPWKRSNVRNKMVILHSEIVQANFPTRVPINGSSLPDMPENLNLCP